MTARLVRPVGTAAARSIHGLSAGADVVVLGDASRSRAPEVVAQVCAPQTVQPVEGDLTSALRQLADMAAASSAAPLVVVVADLDTDVPALLDLLDRPGVRTAAVTVQPDAIDHGVDSLSLARVGRDGKALESVGTGLHVVTSPTHALLGIARVDPADRATAAELWRQASEAASPAWGPDAFAAAMVALVRGGLLVSASPLGPFRWSRAAAGGAGASGDPWRQRLRGASRGGDGFFSTYAVRPLSRRLTAVGLARGWHPNAVTLVSLVLGVLAAGLVLTGWWWAWVVGAVLLMLSLVVDCVDGEIARFTRRFSPLGAFLDAVGDRVKEYSVLAAVAAVAVRDGLPGWPVALAAMAVVTIRHLEDYAYEHRLGYSRRSRPDVVPVSAPRDLGPADARTVLPAPATRRQVVVHWVKKVIHLPIAERYLIISLMLLTHRPMWVLWALLVAALVAVGWTQGGRVAAALLGRDPTWDAVVPPTGPGHLDHQLDLGPVARAAARVGRPPFAVGMVGALLMVVGPVAALWGDHPGWAAFAVLVGALLVGAAWQPPLHHRLAWQAPAALWVAEAATVGVLVHHMLGAVSGAAFAYVAAVAYHRYDVVYRLRDTGTAPASWLTLVTLGTDGRLLLVLLVAAWAPQHVLTVLWAAAVVLASVFLGESFASWSRWIRSRERDLALAGTR